MIARPFEARPSERGIALLLTLLVLTILLILAVQLAYSTKVAFGIAKDRRNEMQIDYAFRGILYKAEAILRYDQSEGDVDSRLDEWNTPDFVDPEDMGRQEPQPDQAPALDETQELKIKASIVDEESKFNLSHLLPVRPNPEKASDEKDPSSKTSKKEAGDAGASGNVSGQPKADLKDKPRDKPFDEQKEKERHKRAVQILGSLLDEFRQGTPYDLSSGEAKEIAEAIDRFLNRDESGRGSGVERPRTKSGLPLSLDELLLIDGVTERLLWDFRDPENPEEIVPGLCNYVTIWSSGKVNVNTAAEVVLRALFDENRRDQAHNITVARGDEEQEKEGARLRQLSPREREEERQRKKAEEKKRKKKQAKGGDLFGGGGGKGDLSSADDEGPKAFQEIGELQKNNILANEDFQKVSPYLSVKSQVFSLYMDGQKGHTKKYQRAVLRRMDGKFALILWETRRDRHLSGQDLEEEGEGLF
jgi:type II secretory pathway component PulK